MIDMLGSVSIEAVGALATVVAIDLALAGDNAIVVGMAAAGLPPFQRRRAIVAGIAVAALLRILFAIFTLQLLQVVGLTLAGGLLLLWVAWKLWREIGAARSDGPPGPAAKHKSVVQAIGQIVVADVSMSLDNVLAVAGAAREHVMVLIIGLTLSVALMGLAANLVSQLLRRHSWLAYVGVVMILYVAVRMIWDGSAAVLALVAG